MIVAQLRLNAIMRTIRPKSSIVKCILVELPELLEMPHFTAFFTKSIPQNSNDSSIRNNYSGCGIYEDYNHLNTIIPIPLFQNFDNFHNFGKVGGGGYPPKSTKTTPKPQIATPKKIGGTKKTGGCKNPYANTLNQC